VAIEQQIELRTSQRISKIIPGLQSDLRNVWNRLLWEPSIKEGVVNKTGYPIEAPQIFNQIGRGSYGSKHIKFVVPNGELYEAVFERSVVDGRVHLKEEPKELVSMGNKVLTYTSYAPKAERVLRDLRQNQMYELMSDPNGRDVIWRRGERLFNLPYRALVGYGVAHRSFVFEPVGKVEKTIVRGRFLDGKLGFYCPLHIDNQLVKVTVPSQHEEDEEEENQDYLRCPVDQDHFSIPIAVDSRPGN